MHATSSKCNGNGINLTRDARFYPPEILAEESPAFHVAMITYLHGVRLDYNEETHQSGISWEWSNTIGYKMSFSPVKVYTTSKISSSGEFQAQIKKN